MSPFRLVIKSFLHYLKRNFLLALGISVSTAVLTGALIVGDSVQHSLSRIVELRLGEVTHALVTGDRYFTSELADNYALQFDHEPAPVLSLEGIAVRDGGRIRINDIQVLGIDGRFDNMAGTSDFYGQLSGDSVIISSNLADRMDILTGEEFLLRMTKASLVPVNAPFVSDAENTTSLRVTVKAIAGKEQMGAFNLENSQTAPFNIFISANRLTQLMELGERGNMLLFSDEQAEADDIRQRVATTWDISDLGLRFNNNETSGFLEIKSDRVFIDDRVADAILTVRPTARGILTYFVNFLATQDSSTPYSFVSTVPDSLLGEDEMIINEWLADDLDAGPGDTIRLGYYEVGPLRELFTAERSFVVSKVVPIKGQYADRSLMPDIPGLSDAGNCRDWDTGVPISLDSIRDKDEEYWERYKGTPKAFISVGMAEDMWENRFGKFTSFRIDSAANNADHIKESILAEVNPAEIGFRVNPVLKQATFSARNGVDFTQLFVGLSFFLLAGAIILSVLLFRLNLGERKEQLSTLRATGIPRRTVLRIVLTEGMFIALAGSLMGIVLAVLYNRLVFMALNSIWMDIVRTEMLESEIRITTLAIGLVISLIIAFIAIFFPSKKFLKLLDHATKRTSQIRKYLINERLVLITGATTTLIAVVLIVIQFVSGEVNDPAIFFIAGGLLLIAGLSFIYGYLGKMQGKGIHTRDILSLGFKNSLRNRTRSITIVILFALGTFLVISTGSNKKDIFVSADEKESGTGGFLYYAESTVPVLENLSDPDKRYAYGLGDGYSIVQMRVSEGDDASCLNLNRIQTPRILGVDPSALSGRFSFVTFDEQFSAEDPWNLLEKNLSGKVIPAIADETVIKWSLGMSTGDTLVYQAADGEKLYLRLVAGTAPSIFQGNVIISKDHFLTYFPQNMGTSVFLVDGPAADSSMIRQELEMGMRDLGWEMQYTASRLAEFNSVTNTYLSIFLVMGALGLLLGTIGLSIVLFRSIIERREELAILRAVGYGKSKIRIMIMTEYLLLLFAGTVTGSVAAVISALPSFMSPHSGASLSLVGLIVLVLLVNGFLWVWWLSGLGLRNKLIADAMRNE